MLRAKGRPGAGPRNGQWSVHVHEVQQLQQAVRKEATRVRVDKVSWEGTRGSTGGHVMAESFTILCALCNHYNPEADNHCHACLPNPNPASSLLSPLGFESVSLGLFLP